MLDDLGDGGNESSKEGNQMKKDYYDHIQSQISKEVEDLMQIAKSVLVLPMKMLNKKKDGKIFFTQSFRLRKPLAYT